MSATEFDGITFDLPKNQSNVIKVIGVGGGGSNAINHMFRQGIKGVDFVICNTDAQALENSIVPIKIQLGVRLTEGLGAGANPEIGEKAAIESESDIKEILDSNTKMVFITAGMGGGTGTGAAPVIAKMAREMGILVVGIVTIPFQFEGKMRNEQAQEGVGKLRSQVDSLIVINNNKLREVYGNLGFKAGFSKADEVLATASRGIAEVITHHFTQNIDLRDAKTVLSNSGTAIMGSSIASGSNRASEAIRKALDSPLLNDNKITGAKNVLLLIVSGGDEITIDEIGEINDHIQAEAGNSANIIMGIGEDETLGDAISVTIIATGFNVEQQDDIVNIESKKIIHTLEEEQKTQYYLTRKAAEIILNLDNFAKKFSKSIKKKDDDFEIIDATVLQEERIAEESTSTEDEATETLLFDLPTHTEESLLETPNPFELYDDEITNIEVKDAIEVIPVREFSVEEEKRYSLEDYMGVEEKFSSTKASDSLEEENIVFKKKIIEPKANKKLKGLLLDILRENRIKNNFFRKETLLIGIMAVTILVFLFLYNNWNYKFSFIILIIGVVLVLTKLYSILLEREMKYSFIINDIIKNFDNLEEEVKNSMNRNASEDINDPMNSPISRLLIDRATERKRKMKEFNYKFHHDQSFIEEIEKQPAYKRMGIDLDENIPNKEGILSDTKLSKYLKKDDLSKDDDDIQLRSNNSSLRDNVD